MKIELGCESIRPSPYGESLDLIFKWLDNPKLYILLNCDVFSARKTVEL